MRTFQPVPLIALVVLTACAPKEEGPAVDTLGVARERADSLRLAQVAEATTLRDTAKATLATLLKDPSSATWDSVVVVQPPERDGRRPGLAVCGRMGGGRPSARFVYLSKFTVFVEDAKNREQFRELWSKNCEGEVVLGG